MNVYFDAPSGVCYCYCSCLAYNTPVAVSDTEWLAIQEFNKGDEVLALQSDNTWKPAKVAYSSGVPPIPPTRYGTRIMFLVQTENDISLVVTEEHLFLLADGTLKRANRLTFNDQLVDEKLTPVGIRTLVRGKTKQGFHNISTSPIEKPGDDKWNHLINTSGIISGDFYAQLYLWKDHPDSDEIVGSPEYIAKYGKDIFKLDMDRSKKTSSFLESLDFVPFDHEYTPPAGARSLVPEYMEKARPGMLRSLDTTVDWETAHSVRRLFERSFPKEEGYEITVEWADNRVNAYACESEGIKKVEIMGGLCRHQAIKEDGLALAIAHELGHHEGRRNPEGSDRGCGNLACEGEADYWAANIGMRIVYYGEDYIRRLKAGADQLHDLFANGLISTISYEEEKKQVALDSCAHPPADCRRETYLAAVRGDDKPTCAGPPNP
jgi:hypothetical protein